MRFLVVASLLLLPFTASAAPDYKYCEITGLALGADKEFVGSVAARIVDKQGLTGESGCQAVWADAYQKGKRLSAGGQWSKLDMVTWQKLQDFETKVLDSVINGMQLGL
ncbi:hypothetical protein N800_02235 [Lysobacter daejeonensis GH1-9]|uniref:Lipoprotein n=1 Tax=Lysobacter daejeonensis GH1-9 TaxID=1385517 RepID=A0A0A0EWM4_9GAMM|nr:hypothetical protein [Lysobacter daejeonensis]KGM54899.1 hypothetical protein N800_02235 [Lysobacter daejeonensis GH1-9]